MKWIKKGLIFCPKGDLWWAKTHAMLPTPEIINNSIIRIYVSFCDENLIGRIGYVDVDANNPLKVINYSKEPLLDIGKPGTFDDNGVHPTSIVNLKNNIKYIYYFGFQLGIRVRYFLFSGLAISINGGKSFQRYSYVPILDRSDAGLYVRSAPFVILEKNKWKMWYVEGNEWITVKNKKKPLYRIKYNESYNGINWNREGKLCIDFKNEDEFGFGRPFIIKEDGLYKMFYSIRGKTFNYKLGYAESVDGIKWTRRDDEIGIECSKDGWDSEMICYSSLIKYKNKTYMFYNGNDFGRTGFGYAILRE
ncbi:MAG: hypothetical protein ACP6IY_20420 [Promethearchaeia archaeon]